jgi:hypothetical protein
MLDAYIIERIRRERERARAGRESQVPLHIDDLTRDPRDRRERVGPVEGDDARRGSVVIDYTLP